ncbi:MAG: copper-translocating P-type ATPase [Anaplasmataceae bacterium]|nr:copper-translocating P-type ATPase [Anaplasmataceae bacterium]
MKEHQEQLYVCPMHLEIIKNQPGLCSECGMKLVLTNKSQEKYSHEGHNKHAGHSTNIFKNKFWVSFILSIPVVLYSDIVKILFGWQAPAFTGSEYLPLTFSTIIFFYGGWIFLTSAKRELQARLPGMMTLISLAITVAYSYSLYITFTGGTETLFWELSTLITIMLLGHWIEMRAVTGAQGALKELSKLLPDQAEVLRDGKTVVVPLSEVKEGDTVIARPGSKIPTDGTIIEGLSEIDESLTTGESKPVSKKVGDSVIAGTINGDGSLQIKVTNIGEKTFLAGVMRLVAKAQSSKSRLQLLSDRAAFFLTILAISVGGVTLASWLILSDPAFAVERTVAVLVIACPHALGLAIPLVASISTTKAAQNGFLVKERLALEAAKNVDVVLFDKTGTLTLGKFGVWDVVPEEKHNAAEVLKLAAAVDNLSEHPIAQSIVKEANRKKVNFPKAANFSRLAGKGSTAEVDGKRILVGSEVLLTEKNIKPSDNFQKKISQLSQEGKTIVFILEENKLAGAIALADVIREESREAISKLKEAGIETAMITGDAEDVARWVAGELKLDNYFARVLPEDKSEKVKLLQSQGKKVAMVGDGINDAPALTQADLGIAIGAGTNVAIESAGIILVKNDPRDIEKIIKLSKLTYAKMIQNLFWAAGYNVVAIPLAAGALAYWGFFLQPAVAAALMSLSTVVVAINAVLLKKKVL